MENLIISIINIYSFAFIARALMSWFPISRESGLYPIASFINDITEPVLAPIRANMPRIGVFDFSILVAIFGLRLLVIPIVRAIIPG